MQDSPQPQSSENFEKTCLLLIGPEGSWHAWSHTVRSWGREGEREKRHLGLYFSWVDGRVHRFSWVHSLLLNLNTVAGIKVEEGKPSSETVSYLSQIELFKNDHFNGEVTWLVKLDDMLVSRWIFLK